MSPKDYLALQAQVNGLIADPESMQSVKVDLLDILCEMFAADRFSLHQLHFISSKLNQAISYIHDRSVADITVAEIAKHCSCSPRMLQYMFNESFGMGPKQYCKVHVANEIHRAIARSSADTSFEQIARQYNISAIGRFSGEYFKLFGTYPLNSLKKRNSLDLNPDPLEYL